MSADADPARRPAILGEFRRQWLDGPLPMVVDHAGGDAFVIAAPSLWMSARAALEALPHDATAPVRALAGGRALVIGLVTAMRAGRPLLLHDSDGVELLCVEPARWSAWRAEASDDLPRGALVLALGLARTPEALDAWAHALVVGAEIHWWLDEGPGTLVALEACAEAPFSAAIGPAAAALGLAALSGVRRLT